MYLYTAKPNKARIPDKTVDLEEDPLGVGDGVTGVAVASTGAGGRFGGGA